MSFQRVIGQPRVKRFFERAIKSNRLSHAYLFVGQSGFGKEAMALELAGKLLAPAGNGVDGDKRVAALTHPDLHLIFPSPVKLKDEDRKSIVDSIVENPYCRQQPWANPSISIENIRELRRKAMYKSFELCGRVILIFDCERMTIEAANSLLKILEEPPDKMYLIMTSNNPGRLLPTIKSRCHVVKFDPLPATLIEETLINDGIETGKARLAARLAGGSYSYSRELLSENLQKKQELALEFFRKSIQNPYAQVLHLDKLLQQFQRDVKSVKELLSHLLIWFRDALIYRECQNEAIKYLVLVEQVEVLKKFTNNFPNADLNGAIKEIENSLQLLDRNVQVNLILMVLLHKLKQLVGGN